MSNYKLIEVNIDDRGRSFGTIKIENSPKGVFEIELSQLVTKKNKLLNEFCAEDITSIIGIVASEGHVAVNQSKQLGIAKYLPFFSMLFIVAMIASNIGSSKLASIFGITITGGMLSFSFSYAISDIITEVYGFKRARQLIWGSLICNIFLMSLLAITIYAPPSAYWHNQAAFESVLLSVPRIIIASLISYGTGEFVNSYILAKLKIKKKNLLVRIIYSSMVGIVADTMIFSFIAFLGTIPLNQILLLAVKIYLCKCIFEFGLIGVTIRIIKFIKNIEEMDIVDINTKFTPFSLDVVYEESNNIH